MTNENKYVSALALARVCVRARSFVRSTECVAKAKIVIISSIYFIETERRHLVT